VLPRIILFGLAILMIKDGARTLKVIGVLLLALLATDALFAYLIWRAG